MTYLPSKQILHGFAYPAAECYGKPHYLCGYQSNDVHDTRLFENATCMCCGRPATNVHHWPPKRHPVFTLHEHKLRPALFALCGSGTLGCHDGWHGGARYKALWSWDTDEYAQEWWEGQMLNEIEPHSLQLYNFGCWEVYDMRDSRIWQVRL